MRVLGSGYLTTCLQIKYYRVDDQSHCEWGARLHCIELDCSSVEGRLVTVDRETYRKLGIETQRTLRLIAILRSLSALLGDNPKPDAAPPQSMPFARDLPTVRACECHTRIRIRVYLECGRSYSLYEVHAVRPRLLNDNEDRRDR